MSDTSIFSDAPGPSRPRQRRASVRSTTIWALALLISVLPILAGGGAVAGQQADLPTFAERLVAAASAQRWVPVIYNPAYVAIPYPGGDVPWYTGVCTDVVVRAYRELGIDLQVEIHQSRLGSGDKNIDHRRVNVMRKFFARHGKSLPVTDNPEDYLPGDLVTYYVPDGTFSKTHIAIVSDQKTSDGRPMVIHNRGYGVQLEDWLFGSKLTGHYRYTR